MALWKCWVGGVSASQETQPALPTHNDLLLRFFSDFSISAARRGKLGWCGGAVADSWVWGWGGLATGANPRVGGEPVGGADLRLGFGGC
jgi:hypothetical protein